MKELVRKLRIYEREYRNGTLGRMIEETEEVLKEAADAIEMLLAKLEARDQNGEWIPCSEGLPKEDVTSDYYDAVIVTLDNGRVVNGCYRNRDEEWWADAEDGEKYSVNVTGHVIAWQPLPEPYKE